MSLKTEYKFLTFLLIASACAFDTSCVAAMVALNQDVQERFNISYTKATWGLTSYTITFAGFIAFFGRLGDIIGNHYLFIASCLSFSIFSLLCATIPNFEAFAVFRAFQGISGAGIVPSSYALVPLVYEDQEEAVKFLSILSIVFASFFGVGFILGGAFAMSNEGYKGLFYLVFGVMLVIFILSFWQIIPLGKKLKDSETWNDKRQKIKALDFPGSLVFIAGSILVVVGLTEGGESWKKPVSYVCLVIGVILLGLFFTYNIFFSFFVNLAECKGFLNFHSYLKSRQILIPKGVMDISNFWGSMFTCFVNYCCFLSNFYIINQYSLFEENNSPIIAAIKLIPVVIGLIIGNVIQLSANNKVTPKMGICIGFFLMVGSSLILIQIREIESQIFWKLYLVAGLLCGIGSGIYFPYMLVITVGIAPLEFKGITSGVMQTFAQLGSELTFSVLASILGDLTGSQSNIKNRFQNASYFTLASSVLGFIIGLVFIRHPKEIQKDLENSEVKSSEIENKTSFSSTSMVSNDEINAGMKQ